MPTSAPQHSPAPWTARRRRLRPAARHRPEVASRWVICAADGTGEGAVIASLGAQPAVRTPHEIAANARLIAAAPLLLAALRILVLLTRRHCTADDIAPRPDRRVMLGACAAARSIIADIDGAGR